MTGKLPPVDEEDGRDRGATNIVLLVAELILIGGSWLVNAMIGAN